LFLLGPSSAWDDGITHGSKMKLAKLDFPAAPLHFSSSHKVLHDFMYEAVLCDAVWFGGMVKRLLKW
jgi:hypothetical protein